MKTLIHNAIAKVVSQIEAIWLKRLVSVLLTIFLLLSSTACASKTMATESLNSSDKSGSYQDSSPYDKDTSSKRELYKPTQKYQGGMNNYNDDPQYDDSAVQADAKQRVQQAKQNLQKRAANPQEIIENAQNKNPLGEKARETARSVGNSAEKVKSDFAEGTQQGMRNLKANVERAKENVPRVVDQAKQNAEGGTQDFREGAADLAKGAQRAADRASNEIQSRPNS
jgi:hypothetical protein